MAQNLVNATSNSTSTSIIRFLYNSKQPIDFDPPYMTLFEFEKFEQEHWRQWMFRRWHWSIYASIAYVTAIFCGQMIMKNREPFKIRRLLTAWNVALAIFSIMGFLRSWPELHYSVLTTGFHKTLCFVENHNGATAIWGLAFAWSKIFEFGDTMFIVLRKQPLIFLHWYHHVTVCIYCWFAYDSNDPACRWFCTMNYFVHGLMYSYYALKSLQIKLPKPLAMFITSLQIAQMVAGVVINIYTYWTISNNEECNRPLSNIYLAFGMYISYLFLFAKFFYVAYMKKTVTTKKIKAQ